MAYRTVNPILPPLVAWVGTCSPASAVGDVGHGRALRVPSSGPSRDRAHLARQNL